MNVRSELKQQSPTTHAAIASIAVVAVQVAAIVAYIRIQQPVITEYRSIAYPFIWITAGVGTAVWIGQLFAGRPRRLRGAIVAIPYVLVLFWLSGIIGGPTGTETFLVQNAMPGWGPIVVYSGSLMSISLVPFTFVGYLTLGYVVYVVAASTAQSVRAAAIGLASCVSCTAPLLLAVAGIFGGNTTAMVATAGYDIATIIFVGTLALLAIAAKRSTHEQPDVCPVRY